MLPSFSELQTCLALGIRPSSFLERSEADTSLRDDPPSRGYALQPGVSVSSPSSSPIVLPHFHPVSTDFHEYSWASSQLPSPGHPDVSGSSGHSESTPALRFDNSADALSAVTYLPGLVDKKQQFNPSPDCLELHDQRRLIIVFIGVKSSPEPPVSGQLRIASLHVSSTSSKPPKFCRKKSNIRGGPNKTQKTILQEGKLLYDNILIPSTFWWLEALPDTTTSISRHFSLDTSCHHPGAPQVTTWYKLSLYLGAANVTLRCNMLQPESNRWWHFDISFTKPAPPLPSSPAATRSLDSFSSRELFSSPQDEEMWSHSLQRTR